MPHTAAYTATQRQRFLKLESWVIGCSPALFRTLSPRIFTFDKLAAFADAVPTKTQGAVAKPQPNRAKRLECAQLAAAVERGKMVECQRAVGDPAMVG